MKVILIVISCTLFAFIAHGAQNDNLKATGAEVETRATVVSGNNLALNTELVLLKSQIELTNNFQERILSTVYWSLGTLATVVSVLVGFGWFANYKVYERDKEAIKSETNGLIERLQQENRAHFDRQLTMLEEKLAEKLKTDISKALVKLKADFEQTTHALESQLERLEKNVSREFARNDIVIAELKRDKWNEKRVYMNSVRMSVDMLTLAVANKIDYRVAISLDFLLEDLNKILGEGGRLSSSFIRDISEQLALLDSNHATNVSSINSLMEKIKST